MRLDHRALLDRQPARLREDVAGDADLADVVQQRAELEPLQRRVVQPQLGADAEREIGDPARVLRRVLVVRLERVRKRLDGGDERPLEPLVAARVRDRQLRLVRDAAEQTQLALAELVATRSRRGCSRRGRRPRTRATAYEAPGAIGSRSICAIVVRRCMTNGSSPSCSARASAARRRARVSRRCRCSRVVARAALARDEPAVLVLEPDARARRAEDPGRPLDDARRGSPSRLRRASRARGRTRAARSRSRPHAARRRRASHSRRRRRRGRRAPRAGGRRPRRTGRARASRRRSRRRRASRSAAARRSATPRSPACPESGCRTRSWPRRRSAATRRARRRGR